VVLNSYTRHYLLGISRHSYAYDAYIACPLIRSSLYNPVCGPYAAPYPYIHVLFNL